MKKIEDTPSRNPFEVPDGYFDRLPGVILSRVASKEDSASWNWSLGFSLRFAVPIVVLAVACLFWFRSSRPLPLDLQSELAQFKPEQLQEYIDRHDILDDGDLSTEELVESGKWDKTEVDQLEKSVYSEYNTSSQDMQKILDEYDNEL